MVEKCSREVEIMSKNKNTMYVGVAEVCSDWGVSRSKGYAIIKELSEQLKKEIQRLCVEV